MSDAPHEDVDNETGDAPDSFDDRLIVIIQLIDTSPEEQDEHRKLLRRAIILRLLIRLQQDTSARIQAQLDRLGELDG